LSELPEMLGGAVVRSELTYLLVRLDKEYIQRSPDDAGRTTTPRNWYATSAQTDT
jgi:hypothetical protein